MKFSEYKVQIEDKLIDGYISDMTRRYGKIVPTDSASDGDLIYGDFVELDEKGEVVAGGIYKSSTMFLDTPVKEEHKVLIGAKAEGKYDLTAKQISDNPKDLAGKLGIEQQQAEGLNATFRFTVKTINRLLPAEQNAELFEKIYGPGVVNSTEEFRLKISDELGTMFSRDTEQRLHNDIKGDLLNKTDLSLPDAFLKRWLVYANEKPVTPEQVENEYPIYARQLRWQLIENKLIRDNNITVGPDEANEHVKNILKGNFAKYGRNPAEVSDEELTGTAKRVLEKEEEAKKYSKNSTLLN